MKDISQLGVAGGISDLDGADGEDHLVEPLFDEVVERLDVRPEQLPQSRVLALLSRRRHGRR